MQKSGSGISGAPGKAANATEESTWGAEGQHGYVDYLNRIFADGGWRITN
jgi:hypothetical protein